MRKYGKIVIEANTIEEAEKDLEMIKSLVKRGAIAGSGSSKYGFAIGDKPAPAPQKPCCCCECKEDETDLVDEIYEVLEKFNEGCYGANSALSVIASILETL